MEGIIGQIVDILWGWPLTYGLLGVGVYLTFRSGFWQIRHLPHVFKVGWSILSEKGNKEGNKGIMSSSKAMAIAMASAVGVGNIGGVGSAVSIGGPGVMFWLWITALLGMITKMTEVALAVYYRDTRPDGSTFGGPTFYIEKYLGRDKGMKSWKLLASLFGIFLFTTYFLEPETYSIAETFNSLFGWNIIYCAWVYAILVWIVVLGGIKRIGEFCGLVVPFMAMFYVIAGTYILFMNASNLPNTFALIFKQAFTPTAAVGGFAGSAILLTIRTGVSRSLWSNEAGWGTSPMGHATAQAKNPITQGICGVLEVFLDTFVVCTITGLVIINTGAWQSGYEGVTITLKAFEMGVGKWGAVVVGISLFLFAWSTSAGWFAYYNTLLEHAFRDKPMFRKRIIKAAAICYSIPGLCMVYSTVYWGLGANDVWLITDITTALPTYVNLFAVIMASPTFFKCLKRYNHETFGEPLDTSEQTEWFDEDAIAQKKIL